jgi:hypothetical protein
MARVDEEVPKSDLPDKLFTFNQRYFKKVKAIFGSSPAVSEGCPGKENAGKGGEEAPRRAGNGQFKASPGESRHPFDD